MKKDSEGCKESPHIIVTEVPPGFLKRKNVRSHFLRFGNIVRMSIQDSQKFCVITFENHQQARDAVLKGAVWNDMPLKIDFTANHDPYGTDSAIINEELNWFAEEPEDIERPKPRSSKSRSHSKFSDVPPKKITKVDTLDEDDVSKTSEEIKKHRVSDGSKSREKRKTKTLRYLEGIRSQIKSEIQMLDALSSELSKNTPEGKTNDWNSPKEKGKHESTQLDSRPLQEVKFDVKSLEGNKPSESAEFQSNDMKPAQEIKPKKNILENFKFVVHETDRGGSPSQFTEESDSKSKFSSDNKSSNIFGDFKFIPKSNSSAEIVPAPKSTKPFEEFKFSSDENVVTTKVFEDKKSKTIEESEGSRKYFAGEDISASKTDESKTAVNENKLYEETKPLKHSEESKALVKTSDSSFQSRVAATLQDKLNILEDRDRYIRLKVDKVSKIESSTQGTCPDMCPEKERILRELMNIIAPYESLPDGKMDHSKAVKEYARSSADQEEPLPHDLRPEPVLTMTMTYLINCIISRIDEVADENQSNWYDFCWGRLRAIRKDIIQQQLCDRNTVVILEQCARFHIACYDRLWGTSKSQFDDKINTETLVNCLQSLIHMYEDLHKQGVSCPNEAEFNAYLILLKINSGFLMSEYQSYSKSLKESNVVREAVKIHLAYNNNMYSTFFKLAKQTSYLNACLMQRFFQHVRVQALFTTVRAHCVPNKTSNISVQYLMGILKLDSSEDCIAFCESMGLIFNEDDKTFRVSRGDFYNTDNIYKIEAPSSLVLRKRMPIAEAVVGSNGTLPIYLNHTVHDSFTEEGILKESAWDASDQEEKMLRDDVERKLLASQLKAKFKQKLEIPNSPDNSIESFDDNSNKMVVIEPSEGNELENENADSTDNVEECEQSVVDSALMSDNMNSKSIDLTSTEDKKSNTPPSPGLPSPKLATAQVTPPKVSSDFTFSSAFQPKIVIRPPSPPKPINLTEISAFVVTAKHIDSSKFLSVPKFDKSIKLSSPKPPKKPKRLVKVPVRSNLEKPKPVLSSNSVQIQQPKESASIVKKVVKNSPPKEDKEKLYMTKLKKKLSENMKRISARKYLRLWKEKAAKLKSSNEFEAMLLYNMTVKEYIRLWGKPPVKRSLNLANRLSVRKNSNLMVQLILHTDIVDKVDRNVRKVGRAVINALGEKSVKQADIWGNIAQPNPVFCKIVFALPPPPEEGTSFSMKFKNWCKAAFYTNETSKLSEAELHFSDTGVLVCSSVNVVEGLQQIESCANLTALVLLRARDWETTNDTETRLKKLISFRNHPIPVAVLNVGQHIDPINVNNLPGITHFEQCLWTDSKGVERVLCNLAHNVYLYNIKVKPFCNLIELYTEKLFDSLQQFRYFHDGLDETLTDPNNIIYFYNLLVDKIEKEIKDCKVHNYFGTAYEFRKDINKSHNSFLFPDNYNDVNFEKSLSHRCLKIKLKPFKTNFQDKKELMLFFKNYCDDIGCLNVLKILVRQLKLPDNDDISLNSHLRSVHWFPFIESLIKELLSSSLLTFRVVYREDIIKQFIDSHFWFNTSVLKVS